MLILKEKGVLFEENISTYVKMVKYRNRLTHFYYELTPQEIFDIIQSKLDDSEKYIAEILEKKKIPHFNKNKFSVIRGSVANNHFTS